MESSLFFDQAGRRIRTGQLWKHQGGGDWNPPIHPTPPHPRNRKAVWMERADHGYAVLQIFNMTTVTWTGPGRIARLGEEQWLVTGHIRKIANGFANFAVDTFKYWRCFLAFYMSVVHGIIFFTIVKITWWIRLVSSIGIAKLVLHEKNSS
jgi:hypothetical protein